MRLVATSKRLKEFNNISSLLHLRRMLNNMWVMRITYESFVNINNKYLMTPTGNIDILNCKS